VPRCLAGGLLDTTTGEAAADGLAFSADDALQIMQKISRSTATAAATATPT